MIWTISPSLTCPPLCPAGPSPLLPRSDGCGARILSARRSGVPAPLASVRRPSRFSPARRRVGPSCSPPLRPVRPGHLGGRGDVGLIGQVVRVAEHEVQRLQASRELRRLLDLPF